MDKLAAMQVFVRVARAGSFAEAADQLGMAKSVVSRLVTELEAQLGVTLIQRTTRQLTLSRAGEIYLRDCVLLLSDLAVAEERAASDVAKRTGILRIGAPLSFGTVQLPGILPPFQATYPDISINLTLLSRNVDLAKAGFDLIIHIWGSLPTRAVARRISHAYNVACAAPAYLKAHGVPEAPDELASHRCLIANFNTERIDNWRFSDRSGTQVEVKVTGHLECNQTSVLHRAALAGEGVVFLPTYIVGDDLAKGSLIHLFPQWRLSRQDIYAVHLSGTHVPTRVRYLVDFMLKRWGQHPPWNAWVESQASRNALLTDNT